MTKTPLITIIGVPNTGKSTLFNRLIGEKKALIHSDPGMTRDIFQKTFEIHNKEFKIQDSGGFFLDDQIITEEINKRIFKEAKRSDLIIFLFDGKRELLGYEKDLFLEIRKLNSRILPVINKVDNPGKYILPNSYYQLKQDFLYISSEHLHGLDELTDRIEEAFADYKPPVKTSEKHKTRISIMGKPNVGKSSIINKILADDHVIVSPIAGTTRDSVDIEIKREGKTFILVDNAGIRKLKKVKEDTESAAVVRAEKDILYADIIIFVIDASKRIDQNDLLLAHKLLKAAKPIIIAANKWDLLENADKNKAQHIIEKIRQSFNFFYFAPLVFVSALTGKNIFNLIDKAEEIHKKLNSKLKTSQVNKVIQSILSEQKFLTESNNVFNPKYITIETYQPFFVTFYTSSKYKLKPFHERYLKKRIGEEFELEGIPVFIKISSEKNK
ncbi:MAG TPA: ribosome biogenesis GTPase Der [Candidatus Deferrimicrobium sp.]|nr:ribosome biogenesis GTPase Der [Candidatus Deferrimicrobium sp.]